MHSKYDCVANACIGCFVNHSQTDWQHATTKLKQNVRSFKREKEYRRDNQFLGLLANQVHTTPCKSWGCCQTTCICTLFHFVHFSVSSVLRLVNVLICR